MKIWWMKQVNKEWMNQKDKEAFQEMHESRSIGVVRIWEFRIYTGTYQRFDNDLTDSDHL